MHQDSQPLKPLLSSQISPKEKLITSTYFFLQGVGSQLPFQALLSTLDFFTKQYPHAPLPVGFTFPAANSISSTFMIFFMILLSKKFSLNSRVAGSNYILILLLSCLPILASLLPDSSLSFWINLSLLFLTGFFFTAASGTVAGLGALFPAEYRSKNAMGCSCAGVFTNVIRAVILAILPADSAKGEILGVYIYYTVSGLILGVCIISHYVFVRTDYAKQILKGEEERASENLNETKEDCEAGTRKLRDWEEVKESLKQLWEGFKEIKLLSFVMVVVMMQFSMLFPGLVFAKKVELLEDAWKNTVILLIFNVCDVLGKFATLFRGLYNKNTPLYVALFRMSFFVIFITTAMTQNVPIIDENWFFFLSIIVLGLTGGFFVGSLFVMMPEYASEKRKETSGFLGIMCLMMGITIGSNLSIPLATYLNLK